MDVICIEEAILVPQSTLEFKHTHIHTRISTEQNT